MADIAELTRRAAEQVGTARQQGQLSKPAAENLLRWLTGAAYEKYQPRLVEMIEAGEWEKLGDLFWEVIPFGTGGRRGMMAELGSATVNERTIAESAQGLADYLRKYKGGSGGESSPAISKSRAAADEGAPSTPASPAAGVPPGRAVVAHDTRNRSDEFARLTATTLAAGGLKVFCFDSHRSTPELSFAVRHLHCDVGVMISASHNPPSDNGFKAYWSHGGQVLPPHDEGIIECVYQAGEIPTLDFDQAVREGRIEIVGDEVDEKYITAVRSLSLLRAGFDEAGPGYEEASSVAREAAAVFTPLHGVGETSVFRVLQEAGFRRVEMFQPHRSPDGNFPNVPDHLPNPERPEVFQPAMGHAREIGAELILASDPDADRLGICVKDSEGQYVHLSGNRIGALLVDYVLRKRSAAGTLTAEDYVVQTLVTTPLIAAIARSHGVRVIDNLLVGFKYIAQTMDREGPERFVFGAEESLGYLAGSYCRDKDAAIAALYLMELAGELRSEGKSLLGRLDELFAEHGYFVEGQRSEVCPGEKGREQIDALMARFREAPPTELAGVGFARVRDYGRHEIRRLPDNTRTDDLPQPEGNVLFLDSQGDDQTSTPAAPSSRGAERFSIAVRPSGTEPKIKFYFFGQAACPNAGRLAEVKAAADQRLSALQDALSQWVRATVGTQDG